MADDDDDDNDPSVAPMRNESAASSVSCAASTPADSKLPSCCHVDDDDKDDKDDDAINCSGAVHETTKSGRPANRAISLSSARWFSPCSATLACEDDADEVANAA